MSDLTWRWERASRSYGNFGNANQWTVNAGLASLARESAQNTNDARVSGVQAELRYTFIRLTGDRRRQFEDAVRWTELAGHLDAMGSSAGAAVTAGQIKAGLASLSMSDELVLLQISDHGCVGLTGPEFRDVSTTEYGNFIKLCRLDLFSGKDEAAGGSFGLGKAVYWRFSRIQTVLFNSSVRQVDAVGGHTRNRLFGVNAGVIHDHDDANYQGRGYFGVLAGDDVASTWASDDTVDRLHVTRPDDRPGTTALLLGFYDPDEPDAKGTSESLVEAARKLRLGVEESFWPLLARERMKVRIRVTDDGSTVYDEEANPEETYTELVRALRRFDAGTTDDVLGEPDSVVVRDIPIEISARRDDEMPHGRFTHHAKLVVTPSNAQQDNLENSVCLLRRPEMVVQTLPREFEGRTYHAFLLAGASINPDAPSDDEVLADDFLRFAEPPAHDRWIPGSGRNQASQANLTGRYVAPWLPNLRNIHTEVLTALYDLFGAPPVTDGKAPEAILRNLRFLQGEPGTGGAGASALRKPEVDLVEWHVVDGRWNVVFEITARNRAEGWAVDPLLKFVGLDGKGTSIAWESLTVQSGDAAVDAGTVTLSPSGKRRKLTAVVRGLSVADLPIPAQESAIDVVVGRAVAPRKDGE